MTPLTDIVISQARKQLSITYASLVKRSKGKRRIGAIYEADRKKIYLHPFAVACFAWVKGLESEE